MFPKRAARAAAATTLLLASILPSVAACARPDHVRLYAASSLAEVADSAAAACAEDPGIRVVPTIAGTSLLARQLIAGAPPGVLLSADAAWADELENHGLVASRQPLLTNSLVCVFAAPPDDVAWTDALRNSERLALADTESVPAGRYARAALESAGSWADVEQRVVAMPDVRAALSLVLRGDVDAAIVYATDAAAFSLSDVIPVPSALHPPITYTLVVGRGAPEAAEQLAAFLRGPRARRLFEDAGFGVIEAR